MIKLTKDDVGKKFNSSTGFVMEVLIFGSHNVCVKSESGNMDTFSHNGRNQTGVELVSRHYTRPWLKDMPDLGDIKDGWIACDKAGCWHWFNSEPFIEGIMFEANASYCSHINCFYMPNTLTGEQWRESKMSIAELKQWQLDNKG